MYDNLDAATLQAREDEIFIKVMSRKWLLDAACVPLTHDKLYCLWKWQLDQIEEAKLKAAA